MKLLIILLIFVLNINCDEKLNNEISELMKTIIHLAKANNDTITKYFMGDFQYIDNCLDPSLAQGIKIFLNRNIRTELELSSDIIHVTGGPPNSDIYTIHLTPNKGEGRIELSATRMKPENGDNFVLLSGKRYECENNFVGTKN